MKKYKQLNPKQRYAIQLLLSEGYNQSEIALKIGVNKSTISREFSRNVNKRGKHAFIYDAERAQAKATLREVKKRKFIRFTEEMKKYMRRRLKKQKWSPEIISAKGAEKYGLFVSAETIYKYIWQAKKSNHRLLRTDNFLFLKMDIAKRKII